MLLVTKNLAELCTLVIDDIYGELPSRIFAALLNRGRAGLPQLAQYTSLTPKQLRHGLAVLLQYDLLYFYVSGPDRSTVYDANPAAAYNLLRTGTVLEMVDTLYGSDARDVMQSMFALGHTRIADLKEAYKANIDKADAAKNGANGANGTSNGHTNGHHAEGYTNGDTLHHDGAKPPSRGPGPAIRSLEHLNSVLCRLVHAEVLEVVTAASFKSFPDRQSETREKVKTTYFSDGIRGLKKKEEFETRVSEELYNLRDEPRKLKRTLQTNGRGRQKLRKLLNGDKSNGFYDDDRDPPLDPKTVLRVNHEKCAVELRNRRLVQTAAAAIGETTAEVYGTLLRQLTDTIPRCRADPLIDIAGGEFYRARAVNTSNIFDNLNPNLDVFTGIGKAAPDEIDIPSAERLERHAKVDSIVFGDEGGEAEDFDLDNEDYDSEGEIYPPPPAATAAVPTANGHHATNGATKGVKFDESAAAAPPTPPSEEVRMQQMRQHLLLLCDNKLKFVRHCDRGTWTVDFEPLFKRLRELELDNAIERKVGRQGLRLARILRDKGKLDEKTLPTMALMKKSDVQNKMLEMQMHGFVDMQEVPRDNNRSASRTLFLWFCDSPRSLDTLLDNAYKAMVRCLRIRDVHRRENKEVLTFVQRPDVKGREKEALEKKYFDKYQSYCEIEQKLMGQVMRLDSLVATLRDF
ncbi:RNA polymerase III subunit C82 [Sporothrix curviconia]|uniref:DNA-directed RNA polymerase III subunit RPC3 n=1 Tax=Sporothrix curviconia TaxID=1260050 RepID=A0ABP0AQD1_9PEZI